MSLFLKEVKNEEGDLFHMHENNSDFDGIIDQYGGPILNYCYHMLRNFPEAQDATQEVFLKAYIHYPLLNNKTAMKSWLYRIAYHHCLNQIRKRKLLKFIALTPESDYKVPNVEEVILQNQFSLQVELALNLLSFNERHVLILRTVEQMEYFEIAAILNKKESAVRKLFERGKRKVEKHLTENKEVLKDGKIAVL